MLRFTRADGLPDVPTGATLVVLGDAISNAPADYGANAGFLREDAVLAIVLVADEDDCSVSDPDLRLVK